jgi:parallel beta-helix repeat protein
LAVASQGEWIQVLPGTYDALSNGETFPVTVPAGVTLIGDEPNKGMGVPATLISGDGLVNGVSGGAIKAGIGATIAGFQLVDAVGTFIVYLDANGVTVRNNSLPGPSSANAIYINSSSNHVIAGNFEQNNARGLGIVGTSSGTRVENNTFRGNAYGVEFDVPGGDLGGGPTGSVGGNLIYCNTANDLWTNAGAAVPAMNNGWDHNPQTLGSGGGADIYDPGLIVNSSGAFQATGPCLNTFVVNATTGLDSNTGAAGSPFKTITHALSLTGSGDTVQVQPGTYDVINGEIYPIAVPAGVSLIGDEVNKGMGGTPTVISGDGVVSGGLTGAIKAGIGATIAGFQIADTVGNFTVYLGANGITLRNNTMPGPSTNAAIYFDSSSNHFITGNVGQNNNWGILAQGTASGSRIENNNFSFNLYGLEFDTAAGDLGGGATGSVGGNLLYCNSFNDLWTNSPVSARNNGWDHLPPTSQDINNLPVVDSTGAFQVAVPCP